MLKLLALGSSPRVRGKPDRVHVHSGGCGLIPACAGKTSCSIPPSSVHRAHPRVCGENRLLHVLSGLCDGSSPRVRGKHVSGLGEQAAGGLIPACAGKTFYSMINRAAFGAHPRVCGENSWFSFTWVWWWGSSPRVRGKLHSSDDTESWPRLIPACAGKTMEASPSSHPARAHPRVCGENGSHNLIWAVASGSSPRVRGKRACVGGGEELGGLIPACAGKTGPRLLRS